MSGQKESQATMVSTPLRTLVIAHRGARSLAPENTLAAASKAYAIGADLWELDVAMTSDGELFVLHDDTLERTSNAAQIFPDRAPWRASDFTWAEIRSLDFGSWYNQQDPFGQIAAGAVSAADQQSYVGEHAPSLREALEFTKDHSWRVNVEIKDLSGTPGDAQVVEKVVRLIDEMGMTGQVMISSFNHSYLTRVKQADPSIKLAALVEKPVDDPASLLDRLGVRSFNPGVKVTSAEQVRSLTDQGYEVYVWTVNDETTMRNLIEAGVSGIFTDFPQRLKEILG
jgi:glycerophosphoryl diester phosphodiesterase